MDKLAYTIEEAAEALCISSRKLSDLMHTSGFPVVSLGARKIIPVLDLQRWLSDKAASGEVVQ